MVMMLVLVLATLTSGFVSQSAFAQRRRLEVDLLSQGETRQEIGLSEAESEKVAELLRTSTPDSDFFKPYLERIGEADDAEKDAIRKEMFAKREEMTQAGKAKVIESLTDEQKKNLRSLFLESARMRAFTDARVAKEYEVTEEQIAQITKIDNERRSAERKMDDDASNDDWAKFDTEWQNKFLAVLNEKQQAMYKVQATRAKPASVATGTSGSTGNGSPTTQGTTKDAVQQPAGESMGSFGASSQGGTKLIESFSFNFRNEMWERVLQMYADGAGLTLDLNQVPPGTFSHFDNNSYSAVKTMDILNGYLNRKGFVMIQKDGFLSVMNVDNGIPPYLIRDVSAAELLQVTPTLAVGENELANFKMDVDGMDAAKLAQEIEAVLGPLGSMVALTESKVLILTDVGANLRRIHGFLVDAKSKSKPDTLIFRSYFIKNMDAEEAEIAVMTQFGMRQNVQNVSAGNGPQSHSRTRQGQGGQGSQNSRSQSTQTSSSASTAAPLQIASDLRLNSLLITGTAVQHELVETILKALDVSEGPNGESLTRGRKGTYLEVYQVNNSDTAEVTKTLTAMNIPGVTVVNEDGRNGRIHIMATERQHEEVAILVRQLDGAGSTGSVAVIPLTSMDPISAAATLRSLFFADGDAAPTIETDLIGRRLIIRGNIESITQIRAVLADLGEDGSGVRPRGEGGLVRRFSLQGRNPEQFLQVLQQQWESQQGTKINIVVPNDDSPIRSRRTPDQEIGTDQRPGSPAANAPAAEQPSGRDWNPADRKATGDNISDWGWKSGNGSAQAGSRHLSGRQTSARKRTSHQSSSRATGSRVSTPHVSTSHVSIWQTAAVQEKNMTAPKASMKKSDVVVQLMGDDLLLVADDPSALDELEALLDMLHRSLPMKPEWTVVYLKQSDATEAADMLSQFFPSSSVSSPVGAASSSLLGDLGASLGNVGSNLLDATGLSGLGMSSSTLRIIPDIRTNSLFITGPQSMINDALSFLQVLDSDDVPNSQKDMEPRQIALKYADVSAVASVVRDVFSPYLEAPNQQRRQQANPLAAMFGGGGGGAAAPSATGVRMTLGIDTNTSTITINSNQEIYDEVASVILQMDQAAELAHPTVRSIQLRNTDAAVVQTMLRNLMPKVSVSSSSTSRTSSGGGGGGRSSSSSASQNAQNQLRQRALQQLQGGGGGRSGGGGATGGRGGGGGGGRTGGAGGGGRGGGGGGRAGGGGGGR